VSSGSRGNSGDRDQKIDPAGNHMKKRKMAVTGMDRQIMELADRTGHKELAVWAADCAERVLPYFEKRAPKDDRPRKAIEALRAWVKTGVFRMADVRRSSLDAHAAARDVAEDDAARSAARAAGQAMAAAHVPRHALAAAIYAATAVRDAADLAEAEAATVKERNWQYLHLLELAKPTKLNLRRPDLPVRVRPFRSLNTPPSNY
jgi:hypothetical protein